MSAEQQAVFTFSKTQLLGSISDRLCMMQGKTGSNKSLLISFFKSHLHGTLEYKSEPLKLRVPAGVAAVNFSGATTYSVLRIPMNRGFRELRRE